MRGEQFHRGQRVRVLSKDEMLAEYADTEMPNGIGNFVIDMYQYFGLEGTVCEVREHPTLNEQYYGTRSVKLKEYPGWNFPDFSVTASEHTMNNNDASNDWDALMKG